MIDFQNIAVIEDGKEYSFQNLYSDIFRLKEYLEDIGIEKGDRVIIIANKGYKYQLFILALIHMNAIAVPISDRLTISQVEERSKELDSILILSDSDDILNSLTDSRNIDQIFDTIQSCILNDNILETVHKSFLEYQERPASIIYTSGSSSRAKAIVHSLENHYYSAIGSAENIEFRAGDSWFNPLPLYHIGGLSIIFRSIFSGATIVYNENDNFTTEYNISHISMVVTQYQRILKSNPQSLIELKHLLLGGSAISDSLIEEAKKMNLNIHRSYGSTEMSSQISTTDLNDPKSLNSSGIILKYRKVKIADDGEILLSGKTLAMGYYQNGDIIDQKEEDGYYHSNDIGFIEDGKYLHIIGRKDNMFISGGENIQSEEIEKYILIHPKIKQAFVIPQENKEYGFRPVCFYESTENIKEQVFKDFLIDKIEKFKIPDAFFEIPDDLLKNLKVSRNDLKKLLKHP